MDRRAFLAVVGSASLAGCGTFFGPREPEAPPDRAEPPESTGYDDDTDPGYDGDPLRVLAFDVPQAHAVGRGVPVSARIRNEGKQTHDATITIAERALDSGDVIDSTDFSGEIDAGATLSLDVQLKAPSEPGRYRVTLGDPDAPAAAHVVDVS